MRLALAAPLSGGCSPCSKWLCGPAAIYILLFELSQVPYNGGRAPQPLLRGPGPASHRRFVSS
eukprot:COSAG04_NODE_194_length_20815_cov_4.321591_13_plen_63_part_00